MRHVNNIGCVFPDNVSRKLIGPASRSSMLEVKFDPILIWLHKGHGSTVYTHKTLIFIRLVGVAVSLNTTPSVVFGRLRAVRPRNRFND